MTARNVATGDAILARFSSDMQNPHSNTDQVERMRGEITKYGGTFDPELVYTDDETSGAIWERPGLQRMLRDVHDGRIRRIFVEDVSRLSRDSEDQQRLRKLFAFHGVQLITPDGVKLDGSSGASLTFSIEGAMSEHYLRDLSDKTRRGLEANARNDGPTGGRTYGYTTGEARIDPEQAVVIRRIFSLCRDGYSDPRIADALNRDRIPAPNGGLWDASCIREMLRNRKYIGDWTYGKRKYIRHPVTRKRIARIRDVPLVSRHRPDLAIIDRELWDAVHAILARRAETHKKPSTPNRPPRKPTPYLLSSLLKCGCCGGLFQISGGSPVRYYRCSTFKKRGGSTCSNNVGVAEPVARTCILGAIRTTLTTAETLAYIRRSVAERLGALSRDVDAEIKERTARLGRTEERIRAAITMQLDGDRSPNLAEMRRDLEAQAASERTIIASLRKRAQSPIPLPAVDAITQRVASFAALSEADPERAREVLRTYLRGGSIVLALQPEGHYIARAELVPVAVMLGPVADNSAGRGRELSSGGCAGRI